MAGRIARAANAAMSSLPQRAVAPVHFLQQLGERVRIARSRRGMTRKILARDSGVSERYLAQLEAGKGNITISLLRRVTAAMGLPLATLVNDEPERSPEFTLLLQMINRLSPRELSEARKFLGEKFSRTRDDGRRERIALIGLRGAGKSTLGTELAQ